MVEMK